MHTHGPCLALCLALGLALALGFALGLNLVFTLVLDLELSIAGPVIHLLQYTTLLRYINKCTFGDIKLVKSIFGE